jgi:DNA-binding transcriptional LysR family regulator
MAPFIGARADGSTINARVEALDSVGGPAAPSSMIGRTHALEMLSGADAPYDLRLSGKIRLTTTDTRMASVLPDILAEFRAAHPEIDIEIAVSNLMFNLRKRDADVAIRPAPNPPGSLIGRRVPKVAFAVYGEGRKICRPRKLPAHSVCAAFICIKREHTCAPHLCSCTNRRHVRAPNNSKTGREYPVISVASSISTIWHIACNRVLSQ